MYGENTKDKVGFAISHVNCLIIGWICYKALLFRCLDSRTADESRLILMGIVLACCLVGILFGMKRERNSLSVFFDITGGFGIYTVLAYLSVSGSFVRASILAALVFALAYAALVFCRRIRNRGRIRKVLMWRAFLTMRGVRNIMCTALFFVMLIIGMNKIMGYTLILPEAALAGQSEGEGQTIENNIETLIKLRSGVWGTLTVGEKMDVLRTVANIERIHLGIPHELKVGADNLEEILLGSYSDRGHQIMLNLNGLIHYSSESFVETVAHEARHAMQYRVVDVYDKLDEEAKGLSFFSNAAKFKEEFLHYVDAEDRGFYDYFYQECEKDARDYSKGRAAEYFERIDEYMMSFGPSAETEAGIVSGTADDSEEPVIKISTVTDSEEPVIKISTEPDPEEPTIEIRPEFETDVSAMKTGSKAGNGQTHKFAESAESHQSEYPDIYRYIGENGLLGYRDDAGNELTPAIYLDASDFEYGMALVREDPFFAYFIDSSGQRATRKFLDACDFDPELGVACVKNSNGTWALIDEEGDYPFLGADSKIHFSIDSDSPMLTAVIDGHAALLRLVEKEGKKSVEVEAEYGSYKDVSALYEDCFMIVTDESGKQGVLSRDGEIVVPAEYKSIEWHSVSGEKNKTLVIFRLTKPNDSLAFHRWIYETFAFDLC